MSGVPSPAGRFLLDFRGALDPPVSTDVLHLNALAFQHARDEKIAVALARVFLTAHDGDPTRGHGFPEALDPITKGVRFGNSIIADAVRRIIVLLARRPSTERLTEEDVPDTLALQRRPEPLTIEMRGKP